MEERDVLIIGGGISGIITALELAGAGIPTILIEREASLGGLPASFSCKASETCNKCFACVVDRKVSELRSQQATSILTRTNLVGVRRNSGKYEVSLRTKKERVELKVRAIVIATGVSPYDASQKAEYGYGRYKNVVTTKDLDEMLRNRGSLSRPSDGRIPRNIAFFQCVGSRDASLGHLYCSEVCCAHTLRLIRALRHQYPEMKATFLYLDIQPAGASFQTLLKSCREDGNIRLIRSLPSKVYPSSLQDTLRVRLTDPGGGEVVEEPFDLIVLSVGMVPQKGTNSLGALLGLALTEDGFFASPPPQTGLFVTGACSGPKDIDRSILHAKSTAFLVQDHLRGNL